MKWHEDPTIWLLLTLATAAIGVTAWVVYWSLR
jgi:hypothetical protein